VLAHDGRVSVADLLRISIDLTGGDVPLGILAAQVWAKQLTNAGRAYPNERNEDVPRELGALASKLEPWRTAADGDSAGTCDKMGPIHHLLASMAAGVWGGPQLNRFAVACEPMLRSAGLTVDHPDPEKGHADACGAAIARWVNDGMPGADEILEKDDLPFVPPPPKTVLTGNGRWAIEGWEGGGRISITIDAANGSFTGELEGWHREPGSSKTNLRGKIGGKFAGSPIGGRLEGTVTYPGKDLVPRAGEGVRHGTDEFTANYSAGKVTGWAIKGTAIKVFSFAVD
jgi:hypothetical protein